MEENMNNENLELDNENVENEEKETYTKEEMLAILQKAKDESIREKDREVTKALKTAQKKHEKEMSLASKDAEERARIELEDRNKELEEMIAQMKVDKARSDLKSTLGARGLDARFADLLNITDDVESNQKVISDFDKIWKASVNAEVDKRIAATETPKKQVTSTAEKDKKLRDMSLDEITARLEEDPDFLTKI